MIYLASPYTHPDPKVIKARYDAAIQATLHFLEKREWVYSPIVHCHELAKFGRLPVEFSFWKEYNFAMIACCSKFIILRIEGYEQSVGVAAEKVEAERLGIPVGYL